MKTWGSLSPLSQREGVKKLFRGPNRMDGRAEEVLERHLKNISIAPQAIIIAQLYCQGRSPITQMHSKTSEA